LTGLPFSITANAINEPLNGFPGYCDHPYTKPRDFGGKYDFQMGPLLAFLKKVAIIAFFGMI
jgi:hypothetical protein